MPILHREPRADRLLSRPRLRELFTPATVAIVAGVWMMGSLLALLASTPYRNDDVINQDIHAALAARGVTLPEFISTSTVEWMTYQGRFFPGSLTWSYSLFWFVENRVAYKLVIGLVLIGAIAVLALFAARVTGRWKAAAVFLPLALGVVQLRNWHDGITSFAGLLSLTTALSTAAVVILISRRGFAWAALAIVSYSLALVTYETVLLFAPVMVAVVVWARRRWLPALAIAIPAALQLGIVLLLRHAMVTPPATAYTISLEPRVVIATFGKQVLAALPLSQWWLSTDAVPAMPALTTGSIIVSAIVVGVPAFLSMVALGRSPVRATGPQLAVIAGFGLWIWLSSSALIAITGRWQVELPRGQGYLSVVYGYFGLALCLLAAYLVIDRLMAGRGRRPAAVWRYTSATLVAALVSLTLAGNLAVALLP